MLRLDVMQEMARLEFAAANWFAKMGAKDRGAYIKAHPRSKYARNTGGVLAQQAGALAGKNAARAKQHDARSASLYGRNRVKASTHHTKMMYARNEAANHYSDAAKHFRKGDHKAGHAALQRGHAASSRADKAHGAYKEKVAAQRQQTKDMRKHGYERLVKKREGRSAKAPARSSRSGTKALVERPARRAK